MLVLRPGVMPLTAGPVVNDPGTFHVPSACHPEFCVLLRAAM